MWKIEFLSLIPLGVGLLIFGIPSEDSTSRQQFSRLSYTLWLISLLGLMLFKKLAPIDGILLIILAASKSSITPIKTNTLFPAFPWILHALEAQIILNSSQYFSLNASFVHVTFLLFITIQTGGLYKVSASYQAFLFFLAIDTAGLFALIIHKPWIYWILAGPALSRLFYFPISPYARNLFFNCPTDIAIFFLGSLVPVGLSWLLILQKNFTELEHFKLASICSAVLLTGLYFFEKSKRQRVLYAFMAQSALGAYLILSSNPWGFALTLTALCNALVWLYFLPIPQVKFINISLAIAVLTLATLQL